MPFASKTPCRGCGATTHGRYCEACREAGRVDQRPSSSQRGYTYSWQQASAKYLEAHPLCVGYPLGFHGKVVVPAECVDHIQAFKGDYKLQWDEANWQPLCLACNSRKGVALEGGLPRD
jgi:5-methylcytosine-specific restriction protein A